MTLGRATFPIYGTAGEVVVTDARQLDAALAAITPVLDEVDRACSRFREDSELEELNRSPGRPVRVGPCLLEATEVALDAARRTGGAVDPTIGRALVQLGYDRDFATLPERVAARPVFARVPGWERVVLDHRGGTVTIPVGTRLDLGATAKAWAADRAVRAAIHATAGCTGVLVSLGGDLALAGPPPDGGWAVQVSDWCGDPVDPSFETVVVGGGGVATSSTTVRRWTAGGEARHHLVDPSTSRPADEVWRTVTVAAGSCVDANVAATAAIVKGGSAIAWLRSTGLPARLVRPDGEVLRVGQWPRSRAA